MHDEVTAFGLHQSDHQSHPNSTPLHYEYYFKYCTYVPSKVTLPA